MLLAAAGFSAAMRSLMSSSRRKKRGAYSRRRSVTEAATTGYTAPRPVSRTDPHPGRALSIPAVISLICHSLSSTYAAIASATRNDLERLVLRARASSLAFKAASILAVMIVLSAALMSHHQAAE